MSLLNPDLDGACLKSGGMETDNIGIPWCYVDEKCPLAMPILADEGELHPDLGLYHYPSKLDGLDLRPDQRGPRIDGRDVEEVVSSKDKGSMLNVRKKGGEKT